jgi:hypothetical protein
MSKTFTHKQTLPVLAVITIGLMTLVSCQNKELSPREEYVRYCVSQSEANFTPMIEKKGLSSPAKRVRNYCECFYNEMEKDARLMEIMMTKTEMEQSKYPEVTKMCVICEEELFSTFKETNP